MSLLEHKDAKVLLEDAAVSDSTVRGCRRRLTRFLERYLPLFYRKEQREHAQLVIQGRLSHLERKTCEPIARQAGVQRKPVQVFVGAGKWDDEAVLGELRTDVAEAFHLLQQPAPTAAKIAETTSDVLRRNEESRIYNWYSTTQTFPPRRTTAPTINSG